MTLNDDFLVGVKEYFYSDSRNPNNDKILQISEFGSQNCPVKVFDARSGEYIRESTIRTEESKFYKRIPIENLPVSLREIYKQKLEQLAQSRKREMPNPVKGLSLTLFPMVKEH